MPSTTQPLDPHRRFIWIDALLKGDGLIALPRAVRKYELQQAAHFPGFLLQEQCLRPSREFENLDALFLGPT